MTDHLEVVPIGPEELIEELRRLRARIPGYEQLTTRQRRSLTRVAQLNVEFVESGIAAAGAYPAAKDVSGRWTTVEHELSSMLGGVAGANLKRRHGIGAAILLIYGVISRLVRRSEHSELIPFVQQMKRTNHIRGKGRRKGVVEKETTSSEAP